MEQWEWAWIAGVFEGEGYVGLTHRCSVCLRISMTDRDVIETINRLCPSPRGIHVRAFPEKLDQYVWERCDREEVREFLDGVLPYLHSRRRAKAEAALERLKLNPGAKGKRTHCIHGHPLSGPNLYIAPGSGQRKCLTCSKRRTKEYQARKTAARMALSRRS